MMARLSATAFKSNSYTQNDTRFGYVDMNMNACKFEESGQLYYTAQLRKTQI